MLSELLAHQASDSVDIILSDSGGQYKDGTIDTTRTMHFGTPTPEQCDAFTRVLQGHVGASILAQGIA